MFAQIDFDALDVASEVRRPLVICHFLYEEMRARGLSSRRRIGGLRFPLNLRRGFTAKHIDAVFGFHGKHLLLEAVKAASSQAV
jgi:hypothetical protein